MSPLKIAVTMSILVLLANPSLMNSTLMPVTGKIEGKITNPKKEFIAFAIVRLTCDSSGVLRFSMTDYQGAYQFRDLPPATDCVLSVLAASSNYSRKVEDQVVIRAGEATRGDLQLVEVPREAVTVSSEQSERRIVDLEEVGQVTTFSAEYLEGLELLGRNYQDIITLAEGIVDSNSVGNPNVLAARAENFKAVIDGVSSQDVVGGTFASNLNTDAIESVEVIQTGGDVSLGRARASFSRIVSGKQQSRPQRAPSNTESYQRIEDNPFRPALGHPLSTFSIDVDTASYSNVRRFLTSGSLPPPDAVRIEEMINYFDYDYPDPVGDHPFSVGVETTGCPWAPQHRLLRVGLKGSEVAGHRRPPANLVFLLDVSGSMASASKLPLVKRSLRLLVEHLGASDTVAIVVYAGAAGLVLPATSVESKEIIHDAMGRLHAGGSTAGGDGIRLAYRIARENFIEAGINRVILATDGDFNVGVSSNGGMSRLIQEEARSGVFFTVLGFGMGNYKDDKLETLADKGNGHYAYIDTLFEARKVLVEELGSTLVTIAKDVKIQIEFNPALVRSYRLIGYENRMLRSEEFNDDSKDAGEIGAGHTVTALYEIVPTARKDNLTSEDPLKYQRSSLLSDAALDGELLTVKIRYKDPTGNISRLLEVPVIDAGGDIASASADTRFAAAVACLGMILRDTPERGTASLEEAERLALSGLGRDEHGYRANFMELLDLVNSLDTKVAHQVN